MTEEFQLTIDGTEVPLEEEAEPLHLTDGHYVLLRALEKARRAMTDDELVAATGRAGNSVRPRRGELAKAGYLQNEGFSRTPSGRLATRWVLTAKGTAAIPPF
jgi:hypothetical protein